MPPIKALPFTDPVQSAQPETRDCLTDAGTAYGLRAAWRGRLSGIMESRFVTALSRSKMACLLLSVAFHGVVLLLLMVDWSDTSSSSGNVIPSVVPVELVTLADDTNMAAMVTRQLPFAPSDEQEDAPSAREEGELSSAFEMRLFPVKAAEKPKSAVEGDGTGTGETPPSSRRNAAIGEYDVVKIGPGTAMTMSVADYLRNLIAKCWRRDRGSRRVVVAFELYLDGSGSIERPPRLVKPVEQDATTIAATESVRQAIYTCAPYNLPPERATQWRQIVLEFPQ